MVVTFCLEVGSSVKVLLGVIMFFLVNNKVDVVMWSSLGTMS